jgi:hypothetical protein
MMFKDKVNAKYVIIHAKLALGRFHLIASLVILIPIKEF